jgi:hypothetical protein
MHLSVIVIKTRIQLKLLSEQYYASSSPKHIANACPIIDDADVIFKNHRA